MLTDWQIKLRGFRTAEDWGAALDLLEQVANGATGPLLGRVRYEHAYTRYSQSPANAPECLDAVQAALALADGDEELRTLCLMTGIGYALHTSDVDVAREFVSAANRVLASQSEVVRRWLPSLNIWVAYYWQAKGTSRFAIKHLRDAIDGCGESNACVLHMARTALGDVLWGAGRREEALRELRRALALNLKSQSATAYLRGRIAHGEGRLEDAERQLRVALDNAPKNDHLFELKAVEALVQVLNDGNRLDEAKEILKPYKRAAMDGWMTRVLVRLQRLSAPRSKKGGDMGVEGS